jgi:hypothetical protein
MEDDELDQQHDNEQLVDVSSDEPTANAPQDEDEEHRSIRRVKNTKCAQRRRNAQNHVREPRDLNDTFAAIADREYHTPIGAIAKVALSSTTLTQPSDTKAAVSDPTRARATRWATSNVFHSESTLEV